MSDLWVGWIFGLWSGIGAWIIGAVAGWFLERRKHKREVEQYVRETRGA